MPVPARAICTSAFLWLAACLPEVRPFTCSTDRECGDGLRCVVEVNACARPDGTCASGWQYVDVGDGVGTCTDPEDTPPPPPFARDVCLVGPAMPANRDACVDAVCAADATCCTLGWSEPCVQAATRTCTPLQGASRCPADIALIAYGDIDVLRLRPDPLVPGTMACIPGLGGASDDRHRWTTQAAWADADGDGDADLALVARGGLRIFDGKGVSPAGQIDLGPLSLMLVESWGTADGSELWGARVAWGDADHDGDLELASHDAINGLRVFTRVAAEPVRYGATTLVPREEMPATTDVGVGWMQLDADLDLELVATLGANFVLFDLQPDGSWTRTTSVAAPSAGFDATFDRLATSTGLVFYAGNNSLTGGSSIGTSGRGVAWGDVDGDGFLDVVIGHHDGVFLHVGRATGFAPQPVKISVLPGANIVGVGIGDLDGNGLLDVYGASISNSDSVMFQRADGGFDAPPMPRYDRLGVSVVNLGGAAPFDTGLCGS